MVKKLKTILLAVGLLIILTMGAVIVSSAAEEESFWSMDVFGVNLLEENPVLPEGVTYDRSSSTITLNNFVYNTDQENRDGIVADGEGTLTVVLQGDNVINIDGQGYGLLLASGNLVITGDGSLTINVGGEGPGNCSGIWCRTFTMQSGNLNINYGEGKYGSFYGITGSTDNGVETYLHFLGGSVKINMADSIDPGYDLYAGIDAQRGEVVIQNTDIEMNLGENGSVFGLAAGYYLNSASHIGGKVTVNNSSVKIHANNNSDVLYTAYFFEMNDVSGHDYYIGNKGYNYKTDFENAFSQAIYRDNRYECTYCDLAITNNDLELEPPYPDVNRGEWFYEYVKSVYQKGIMTGMDDGTFSPSADLSRAQFAVILYRMEGEPDVSGLSTKTFPDVPKGIWFADAVAWANANGIITGYTEGSTAGNFGASDSITRAQMATMMYRYASYKGYDTSVKGDLSAFPDMEDVADFSRDGMEWAVGEEIVTGDQGRLNPQGTASRAVGATIITRFLNTVGQ